MGNISLYYGSVMCLVHLHGCFSTRTCNNSVLKSDWPFILMRLSKTHSILIDMKAMGIKDGNQIRNSYSTYL